MQRLFSEHSLRNWTSFLRFLRAAVSNAMLASNCTTNFEYNWNTGANIWKVPATLFEVAVNPRLRESSELRSAPSSFSTTSFSKLSCSSCCWIRKIERIWPNTVAISPLVSIAFRVPTSFSSGSRNTSQITFKLRTYVRSV